MSLRPANRPLRLFLGALIALVVVLIVAVAEINVHFDAVDPVSQNSSVEAEIVPIMIVTGLIGVIAIVILAASGILLLIRRARRSALTATS